jgi:WD40 repeat protein
VTVLRGHADAVNSVAFFGPCHLLSGSVSGRLKVFHLATRRAVADIPAAHADSVLSVSRLEQGRLFVSAGKDGVNHVWDVSDTAAPAGSFSSGAMHFCNSATDTSGSDTVHFASSAAEESNILFWDIRTPTPALRLAAPKDFKRGMLTSLLYRSGGGGAAAGGRLLGGFENGSILSVDLRRPDYAAAGALDALSEQPILALDLSPDNRHIVAGGGSAELSFVAGNSAEFLEDSENLMGACSISKIPVKCTGTSAVRFRSDGRIFVSGHWDGSIQLRERKTFKLLAVLRHHREAVYCTEFIGDNVSTDALSFGCATNAGIFASGSKDGTIAIWDLFAHKMKLKSRDIESDS